MKVIGKLMKGLEKEFLHMLKVESILVILYKVNQLLLLVLLS